MPSEGFQTPVDRPAQAHAGFLQEGLEPLYCLQCILGWSEQAQRTQPIHLRESLVPNRCGSHRHTGCVVPFLSPGDKDLGRHSFQREVPTLFAGAKSDEGRVGQPEEGLPGKLPEIHQVPFHLVF